MEQIFDCIIYGIIGLLAIGGTILVGYVIFHGVLRLIGIHRAKLERDARIEAYKLLSRDIELGKIIIVDDDESKHGRYPWGDTTAELHLTNTDDEKKSDDKD